MSNGPSRMIFVKVLTYPLRLVDGLLDRLLAIAGAVALSQVPGFISHYLQRLGGHVDEATRNVAGWQEIANKSTGGNLRKLIDFYQASGDTEIIETGKKCVGDLGRLEDLQQAMAAIRDASVWEKPLSFVRHLDPDIARAAFGEYGPNVPVDLESIGYAIAGLVLAVVVYQGVKRTSRAAFRQAGKRLRKRREAVEHREADADAEGEGDTEAGPRPG